MEIEVIEIDQWSATGDIHKWSFAEFKEVIEASDTNNPPDIEGGDAEAIQKIIGGRYDVKTVRESDSPRKGYIWYRESDDGSLERYKSNTASK